MTLKTFLGRTSLKKALSWVIDTFKAHERILFEGNGYSGDWEKLAEERGLPKPPHHS